jgi:predicted AAA+ superfamily ATPase
MSDAEIERSAEEKGEELLFDPSLKKKKKKKKAVIFEDEIENKEDIENNIEDVDNLGKMNIFIN